MADIKDYEDQIKEIGKNKNWSDEKIKKEIEKIHDTHESERESYVEKLKKEENDNDGAATKMEELGDKAPENKEGNKPEDKELMEKRRDALKKYADENGLDFEEEKDGSYKIGGGRVAYQGSNMYTSANTDYGVFLTMAKIEKANGSKGVSIDGKSQEFKEKATAACIQTGLKFENGARYIDLNSKYFKNLDEATKEKITDYNEKNKVEDNYKAKVAEYKKLKENNGSLDFSQIKDPTERLIAYTAAKETGLNITNLANDELIYDEKKNPEKKKDIERARAAINGIRDKKAVKEDVFDMHERRVKSLQRMRQEVKDDTRHRGEYTQDGQKKEAQLRQTINGTTYHVDRKDVATENVAGKEQYKKNNIGKYMLRNREGGR